MFATSLPHVCYFLSIHDVYTGVRRCMSVVMQQSWAVSTQGRSVVAGLGCIAAAWQYMPLLFCIFDLDGLFTERKTARQETQKFK